MSFFTVFQTVLDAGKRWEDAAKTRFQKKIGENRGKKLEKSKCQKKRWGLAVDSAATCEYMCIS